MITMEQLNLEIESLTDYEGPPSAYKTLINLGYSPEAAEDLEQQYWAWQEKKHQVMANCKIFGNSSVVVPPGTL